MILTFWLDKIWNVETSVYGHCLTVLRRYFIAKISRHYIWHQNCASKLPSSCKAAHSTKKQSQYKTLVRKCYIMWINVFLSYVRYIVIVPTSFILDLTKIWIVFNFSSLDSYLFLLLKRKRRAIITTTNIATPTEAPIITAFCGLDSLSPFSVVSVVTINGWMLTMVPPSDPSILCTLLSTMAFKTSLSTISSENPWGSCK